MSSAHPPNSSPSPRFSTGPSQEARSSRFKQTSTPRRIRTEHQAESGHDNPDRKSQRMESSRAHRGRSSTAASSIPDLASHPEPYHPISVSFTDSTHAQPPSPPNHHGRHPPAQTLKSGSSRANTRRVLGDEVFSAIDENGENAERSTKATSLTSGKRRVQATVEDLGDDPNMSGALPDDPADLMAQSIENLAHVGGAVGGDEGTDPDREEMFHDLKQVEAGEEPDDVDTTRNGTRGGRPATPNNARDGRHRIPEERIRGEGPRKRHRGRPGDRTASARRDHPHASTRPHKPRYSWQGVWNFLSSDKAGTGDTRPAASNAGNGPRSVPPGQTPREPVSSTRGGRGFMPTQHDNREAETSDRERRKSKEKPSADRPRGRTRRSKKLPVVITGKDQHGANEKGAGQPIEG
ncbi:hypothetical protein P152DRAFT_452699 [Eremomyces bilateralis CBS 781.70]|uniref:Uncharacterized protein n=1 Tax=Eremomyces bilateralis CBS 781.70 TaxID=1392243 RepID=A0A6G1FSE8_9PEZI|nr:uncharacterized protein P152DRAFT_452699 [Eremomyces bilateralis CBS 781.70]KAF1808609.1 hypothetical protein P152DRAFT_452699 [Eremomyces bilateralis CBS 781.70]